MSVADEESQWIGIADALEIYFRRLGLPDSFRQEFLGRSVPDQPGIMWLSDHAIMVHGRPSGLVFDRADFEDVVQKIKPVELGDA